MKVDGDAGYDSEDFENCPHQISRFCSSCFFKGEKECGFTALKESREKLEKVLRNEK